MTYDRKLYYASGRTRTPFFWGIQNQRGGRGGSIVARRGRQSQRGQLTDKGGGEAKAQRVGEEEAGG
jgi:hypothetical protein